MTLTTGITRQYDQAFYGGNSPASSGNTSQHNYDVFIGGRGYMIDWDPPDQGMHFQFRTMPLLQRYFLTQDTGNVGEQTLNSEDYWRRSSDDWHFGAGQKYNDRSNSERGQFRSSSGIDPWTIGEFKLLGDTTLAVSSANDCHVLNVAPYLYVLDGDTLEATSVIPPSFTTITPAGGDAALSGATSISTDGFTVYVADGTRVHFTTKGSTTFAPYHTVDAVRTLVRTTKGRVFTAASNVLYTNAGAAGSAAETVLLTHPNPDFAWVDVAGGPAAIYFAGFSGDKSVIYSTQVVSDGTNLNVPAVAAELPDGEIVKSIQSYLGVLLIGTEFGVRIAPMDSSGNLNVQGLIETPNAVQAFEPQGRFVWFGGGSFGPDAIADGGGECDLYRMDLSLFNGNVPAYAPDLAFGGPNDGIILSVVTFGFTRVYSKQGVGVIAEDTSSNLVPAGVLYQGWWNYNLPDSKQAVKLSAQYRGNEGTIKFAASADFSTTYEQAGADIVSSSEDAESRVLPVGQTEGVVHEVRVTLERSGTDPTLGPSVTRYTLMSNPQPQRRIQIMVPLLLHEELQSVGGDTITINPAQERQAIDEFCQSGEIISYQDPAGSYSVTVDDYDWIGYQPTGSKRSLDGTLGVTLKVVT